ncbi:hypothetical protein HDU76_004061, partial [Blyttiomyces sp. JEL0837]
LASCSDDTTIRIWNVRKPGDEDNDEDFHYRHRRGVVEEGKLRVEEAKDDIGRSGGSKKRARKSNDVGRGSSRGITGDFSSEADTLVSMSSPQSQSTFRSPFSIGGLGSRTWDDQERDGVSPIPENSDHVDEVVDENVENRIDGGEIAITRSTPRRGKRTASGGSLEAFVACVEPGTSSRQTKLPASLGRSATFPCVTPSSSTSTSKLPRSSSTTNAADEAINAEAGPSSKKRAKRTLEAYFPNLSSPLGNSPLSSRAAGDNAGNSNKKKTGAKEDSHWDEKNKENIEPFFWKSDL